jgi:hypothetical protein
MAWSMGLLGAVSLPLPSYELISSQVLSSNASTVTFASIPQTYKHLQLRTVSRINATGDFSIDFMRINSSSGTYRVHNLSANGSAVASGTETDSYLRFAAGSTTLNFPTGAFATNVIDILDYSSTAKNKTLRRLGGFIDGSLRAQVYLTSGLYISTTAVTRIDLSVNEYLAGSRFSLYGIRG